VQQQREKGRGDARGDGGNGLIMQNETTENESNGAGSVEEFSVRDRYLTKDQVAKLLGVSRRTVDNFMRRGWLVYHKIGRTVRFRMDDVNQHLNETARVCRGRR
jgi:excisionase family DNA binding protein